MRKESGGASSSSSSSSSSSAMSKDVGDEEDDGLGSAGSLAGAGSSSRARMLAQQRELQLKKRQSALQTGGMIRSSLDNGDALRKSAEHQVTPAVRQFSAPKSVRDASAEYVSASKSTQNTLNLLLYLPIHPLSYQFDDELDSSCAFTPSPIILPSPI